MVKEAKLLLFYQSLMETNTCLKTSVFATALNVSTKTIYNYLNELAYELRKYELRVVRKPGVGLMVEGSAQEKAKFITDILGGSIQVPLTDVRRQDIEEALLMYDKVVSVRTLSEKYDVSKSSIVNDLQVVEKKLKAHELHLVKSAMGTQLGGKEQRIRSAKHHFIYQRLTKSAKIDGFVSLEEGTALLSKYVDESCLQRAEEMLTYVKEMLSFEIQDAHYLQIFVQFSLFIQRLQGRHYLVSTPQRPIVTQLHILKTYPIAEAVCKRIEKEMDIHIGVLDIRWVNARIAGVYHEHNDAKGMARSQEIGDLIEELVLSVEDIFNTDLLADKLLINGLEKHFVPMISRLTNNIKISNPFIEQIKSQYTAMFSVTWLACSIVEKRIGFPLSEDEIGFILIHFQAAMERRHLSKRIAIVSNDGNAQSQLMLTRIKSNIPTFDVMEVVTSEHVSQSYLKTFDFIVSTIPLKHIEVPTVVISPIASNADIAKINTFYYDQFVQKKEEPLTHLWQAMEVDTLLLKQTFTTKEDVLQEAHRILYEKGDVSNGFYTSMIEREQISATDLGNGVAIPHGLDTFVHRNRIVLITLQHPIQWGKGEVNVIFVLAINFTDTHFSKQIFTDLYRVINTDSLLKLLVDARNKDDVRRLLSVAL